MFEYSYSYLILVTLEKGSLKLSSKFIFTLDIYHMHKQDPDSNCSLNTYKQKLDLKPIAKNI